MKSILSRLTSRHASEILFTDRGKSTQGTDVESSVKSSSPPVERSRGTASHLIAFLSDGRGTGAPIDYAVEACMQQNAMIDLLIHPEADPAAITALASRIRSSGIDFRPIHLGNNPVHDLTAYIHANTSLIYLVAMPDDRVIKALIDGEKPKAGYQLPVPLVLVEDKSNPRNPTHSAA